MNKLFKTMAILIALISGLQAMEAQRTPIESKAIVQVTQEQILQKVELTPTEKKCADKMWLLKQARVNGTLIGVPEDVQTVINWNLYWLVYVNPLSYGSLIYTDEELKKKVFKTRDLTKNDGSIDLSNKIFDDLSDSLFITLIPKLFFRVNRASEKVNILFSRKSFIEKKIETLTKPFEPIMDTWDDDQAPLGIFFRMEKWNNLSWYYYLTHKNLHLISNMNLYECMRTSTFPRVSKSTNWQNPTLSISFLDSKKLKFNLK